MNLKYTPKQAKFIELLIENYSIIGKRKTLKQMMLEAGYSKLMSENPKQLLDNETIKEGVKSFVDQLDEKRKLALKYLTEKKLKNAPARDNAYVTDILTKNHQLLGGQPTERIELSPEDKKAIDEALKDN